MNKLAETLAQELLGKGIANNEQSIANYIADNSDWEGTLDLAVVQRGSYLTESIMDDFISDVQFYMEELQEVKND